MRARGGGGGGAFAGFAAECVRDSAGPVTTGRSLPEVSLLLMSPTGDAPRRAARPSDSDAALAWGVGKKK